MLPLLVVVRLINLYYIGSSKGFIGIISTSGIGAAFLTVVRHCKPLNIRKINQLAVMVLGFAVILLQNLFLCIYNGTDGSEIAIKLYTICRHCIASADYL